MRGVNEDQRRRAREERDRGAKKKYETGEDPEMENDLKK
jgi:hypothetical protein